MNKNNRAGFTLLALSFWIQGFAADVTVSSTDPSIWFDDTDFGDTTDWGINATGVQNLNEAQFSISDFSGVPLNTIIQLKSNGTYDSLRSFVVNGNGDLSWADGAMFFDRSAQELAIGTSTTPAQLTIYNNVPDILLHDNHDNSEVLFELQDGLYRFYGRPSAGASYSAIMRVETAAPENSLTLNAAGNAGFGTGAPEQAVDVQRSAAAARFQLTSFTNTANEAPQYIQRRARGTVAAPLAIQNGDNLGLFSFRGYNGSVMGGSRATITAQAAGNFTNASTPTRLIFATTPVGQTTPQQVLEITHDGKLRINGVALNVPDYVLEDDYELMPLEKLQAFIDEHGHLPGIPSADVVQAEGLDLAGAQMSHLQKIEELTLYTLQQHGELKALREENARLRARVERIDRLEAQVDLLMQERAGVGMLAVNRP